MKLIYRNKIWKLICPEKLEFPPGVIRNILIENEQGERIITHLNQTKPFKDSQITDFF
jgi:hypothetical protein